MIKEVHFSIDDVSDVLRWITCNEPASIFDTRFFNQLREWHIRYGIKVSLYYYFQKKDFCVLDLQDRYWLEIIDNKDWIRIGYHAVSSEIFDVKSFEQSFLQVKNKLKELSKGNYDQAKILRLHNWQATKETIKFLKGEGVKELLTADDDRESYTLTEYEMKELVKIQKILKEGIIYRKTGLRIENIDDPIEFVKKMNGVPERLVIFTHEWCWETNKEKIEEILSWLHMQDYNYI